MIIRGYLTNLGKYTEGYLVGKWVTFPLSKEEIQAELKAVGVDGVRYEEYFFTDWETDFENDFGEYENIDRINEIAEQLAEWDDEDKFKAACEVWSVREVLENGPYEYDLYCDVMDDYDLGHYWIHDVGGYDFTAMGDLAEYIDYEGYGRDMSINESGNYTKYGYIKRCR